SVTQRVTGWISMFALKLIELVPRSFLVREVNSPLDVYERPRVSATFDLVAKLERPSVGMFVVIGPDLEASRLTLDPPLAVFKSFDGQLGHSVRREQRVAAFIAVDWQGGRLLRRNAEPLGAVAESGDADSGMDSVDGRHMSVPSSLESIQKIE